jgi:hypothetical protein
MALLLFFIMSAHRVGPQDASFQAHFNHTYMPSMDNKLPLLLFLLINYLASTVTFPQLFFSFFLKNYHKTSGIAYAD